VTDSTALHWHSRPGVMLAARYLRAHPVPIVWTPLSDLPQLSKRVIRFALRLFPGFLDKADLSFPIIVAGRDWYKIALDGPKRPPHRTRSALVRARAPLPGRLRGGVAWSGPRPMATQGRDAVLHLARLNRELRAAPTSPGGLRLRSVLARSLGFGPLPVIAGARFARTWR